MEFIDYLSISIAFLIAINAIGVIISKNAVYALLHLIFCVINSSIILIVVECEFLALIFILIYVGSIAVLFLFVIMMLNSKKVELYNSVKYIVFNFVFSLIFLYLIISYANMKYGIFINFKLYYNNYYINWYDILNALSDIEVLSLVLYSYYAIHFLMCGFVLLLTIISVISLTKKIKFKNDVSQKIYKQNARIEKEIQWK